MPVYAPGAGNSVALALADSYAPPHGNSVALNFGATIASDIQFLSPVGIAAVEFGDAYVWNLRQVIAAPSISSGDVGYSALKNYLTFAAPGGIHSLAFGTQYIFNLTRYIKPGSYDYARYGIAVVENKNKELKPAGFIASLFGSPHFQLADRYVYPFGINGINGTDYGIEGQVFGTPFGATMISHRIRTIEAAGHHSLQMGATTIWSKNRYIYVGGIPAGQPSASLVAYRIRYLYLSGIDESAIADYTQGMFSERMRVTGLKTKTLAPVSSGGELFGYPGIVNSQIVITPLQCCGHTRFGRASAGY